MAVNVDDVRIEIPRVACEEDVPSTTAVSCCATRVAEELNPSVNEEVEPAIESSVEAAVHVEPTTYTPQVFSDDPNEAIVPPSRVEVPLIVTLLNAAAPPMLSRIEVEPPERTLLDRNEICTDVAVDCARR